MKFIEKFLLAVAIYFPRMISYLVPDPPFALFLLCEITHAEVFSPFYCISIQ